jgi:predicted nucleic acid-binding protein
LLVLVDTNIWSLALRRSVKHLNALESEQIAQFRDLVQDDRVKLIGPVRQELLTGIRERLQFEQVRKQLQAFSDEPAMTRDYEEAAQCSNRCRSRGISGSNTDFLICAMAMGRGWQIFTADADFQAYVKVLAIQLFPNRV